MYFLQNSSLVERHWSSQYIQKRKKKETGGSTLHWRPCTWGERIWVEIRWRSGGVRQNDKIGCETVWMALRWIDEGTETSGQKSKQSKKWTGKEDDGKAGGRRCCAKQPQVPSEVCTSLGPKCWLVTLRLLNGECRKINNRLGFSLILGSLSTCILEIWTATGSELFSLLICPHTTTFTLLSIFCPWEMSSIKVWEVIWS